MNSRLETPITFFKLREIWNLVTERDATVSVLRLLSKGLAKIDVRFLLSLDLTI